MVVVIAKSGVPGLALAIGWSADKIGDVL
jgi:hypothetical protein